MIKNTKIDFSVFSDYDIRGIYPKQLNKETFYILGQAIASFIKKGPIGVGFDARLSSPILFKALTDGIRNQGLDCIDLGLISTEIHYFASGFYKYPANVIISASHNPPEYNGVKIVTAGATPLNSNYGLPEIKKLMMDRKFADVKKRGKMIKKEVIDNWIRHALTFVDVKKLKALKVVIDASNGVGGISWEKLVDKLPIKIIPMYFKPDGNFPNHLPDPLKKENIKDLQKKIVEEKADLGFAIDGDADRLFVLDEKGNSVSGSILGAMLASFLLQRHGPSKVLYNVVCGKIVPQTVRKFDGEPIRVRVGHSFIKKYMRKYKAIFACEHSGHFYFRDNFNADSSLIAGLMVLEYISQKNKKVSEVVKEFDKYFESGEINYRVKNVIKTQDFLVKTFSDADSIDHIDGLSVYYKDWWMNIRSSKTEPLLRLNLEANQKEKVREKIQQVEKIILSRGGEKT